MALEFKRKDPEGYETLVKRMFCKEIDVEFEESSFMYEPDTPIDECTGCLLVMRKDKSLKTGQTISDKNLSAINQLMSFLGLDINLAGEGIFRKSGSLKKQQDLKKRLLEEETINLENEDYSAHECASVLKTLLGSLHEPLVTNNCYKAHIEVTLLKDKCKSEGEKSSVVLKQILCTQLLLQLINEEYLNILKDVLFLLHSVSKHKNDNKMSSSNLGTIFSTHILSPKSMSPEKLQSKTAAFTLATTFLIENAQLIFCIPEQLEDEVQTLNFARGSEGRRSLALRSKEGGLGVACLVANTVFSFIDKDDDDDKDQEGDVEESIAVCDNLETTVISQLNLNVQIINITK